MQIFTFLFILTVMLQVFRKNPNKKKEEGKNYKKGGIEIWLRYFFIGYHYFCLWCFPYSASMVTYILAKICKETLYLGQICGITPAVSVPEYVFEMLWIFYYGNYLWMHACVTCGCDKDWVTVCCCVVLDYFYVAMILWYTLALVNEM